MNATSFEYTAVNRAGARTSGVLTASSRGEAVRTLVTQGLTPTLVRAGSPSGRAGGRGLLLRRGGRRASVKDIAHFTYQLSVLISARIPIGDGLMSIASQERDGELKEIITDVARRVQAGEQIATSLEAHERVFGSTYIATIRAAEKTGTMGKVLEHLSDMLERQQETRQHVRGALMYPICVVSVLSLAVIFLVAFVVPKFAGMFERRGMELPVFTRLLMDLGLSVQHYWWAYLLAIGAVVFTVRRTWRTESGRARLDTALHRVPYLNRILRGLAIGRFTRVLGVSLSSGLNLLESVQLAGRASGRPLLEADARKLVEQISAGGRLCDILPNCGYISPFAARMLAAGEQSGEIPRMCDIVARHYDRETTHLAKNIATVIEPVLIVGIALVVLAVALAIFLPMWDMVKLVG